ncbi:MAG TPA: DUF748 domain-containing protein [Syntrophorhabdaceae bacterium]
MAKRRFAGIILVVAAVILLVLAASSVVLLKYGNRMIKGELERRLGKAFSIDRIDLTWGHVKATGIKMKNREGKDTVRIDSLSARADFLQFLRKEYVISNLTLKGVHVRVETDRSGVLISPALPPGITREGRGGKGESEISAANPLSITRLHIEEGEIDYLDRKTAPTPVLTRVRDIRLEAKDIALPFPDAFTTYELTGNIVGNSGMGAVKSNGKIKMKTKDLEAKGEVRHLDITNFKAYFQKNSNVNITRGFLDVDISMKIVSRKLHAPGRAVLKDLDFSSRPGVTNQFMGVPLSKVVAFLKKSSNRIPIDFTLTGDLDNPKVNIRDNFINTLSQGLAGTLGLSLKDIGQSLVDVGSGGAKGLGLNIEEIEKGLKNIFTK